MSTENLNLDPTSNNESCAAVDNENVIQLIYGSDDPNKGYVIDLSKLVRFTIYESFFQKLPTLKLTLLDIGTLFHNNGFQIGNKIFIELAPKLGADDIQPKPYISCSFVIQSIDYAIDQDRAEYVYTINAVYAAEKYMNDICIWPVNEDNQLPFLNTDSKKDYTSNELLSNIITKTGLSYSFELDEDTDDNMSWLNSSLTYLEFVEKIVNHAWISEDDMPLFFIDKTGTAHYTSINTLCDSASVANYIQQTKYQKIYDDKSTDMNPKDKQNIYRVYTDVYLSNIGFIQNRGGYHVKKYIFNPYNKTEIDTEKFEESIFDIKNRNANTENNSCFREHDFIDTGKNNRPRLAPIINKSNTQLDNCRTHDVSMHFMQTHENYDYAPLHHETIKHSFYQLFAFMTINTANQPGLIMDESTRPFLGQKVNIDFTSISNMSSIENNNFIIAGLTHDYTFGQKYTIMATCVSDGLGGIGQNKKENKNTQK